MAKAISKTTVSIVQDNMPVSIISFCFFYCIFFFFFTNEHKQWGSLQKQTIIKTGVIFKFSQKPTSLSPQHLFISNDYPGLCTFSFNINKSWFLFNFLNLSFSKSRCPLPPVGFYQFSTNYNHFKSLCEPNLHSLFRLYLPPLHPGGGGGYSSLKKGTKCGQTAVERWLSRSASWKRGAVLLLYYSIGELSESVQLTFHIK